MTRANGLIIAAPSSGSGKTTVTLGILRALKRRGVAVRGAKSGPDYIDPKFHESACSQTCFNLDAWAMRPEQIKSLASGPGLLIVEGAMGLFDGAPPNGKGATADLARILRLPVVLVVDAARMSQSIAPLVQGFAHHDASVEIAGVILNRVGSARHAEMLRTALKPSGIPVLGVLYRDRALVVPSRHLGLVQAEEHPELDTFLNIAADRVEAGVDLAALQNLATPLGSTTLSDDQSSWPHDAKHVAIARDAAFAFSYPHERALMRRAGAKVAFFSPLADEPVPSADLVMLPGGYPELYAERLAGNQTFLTSLRKAAETSNIYGECGGYMILGETLTDGDGKEHRMAGLLALKTSFAARKLHLGYRKLSARAGILQGNFNAHEFHYATTLRAEGEAMFDAEDAEGNALPPMGLVDGRVCGTFAHIICAA